ncbi:MAG TPA: hypothetical protein VFO67_03690, partial [Gemmatimonadales bacterium]|nr:hypothetical protein [Gemmatimonadales bacterium]
TVLVGAGRRLFVGLVSAAGIASGFDQVRFDPDVQVQAAAPAPDGSIHVVVARDSTAGGRPVVSVLELRAAR